MRSFLLLVVLLTASIPSIACDVCGCSIPGGGFGFLTANTRHFLGFGYSRLSYVNQVAPVNDQFNRIQLMGQVRIGDRWRVFGTIPFVSNTRKDQRAQSLMINGLGDVQAIGSYALRDQITKRGNYQLITAGLGLSLPTGRFDPKIFTLPLPEDFNPGRGAVGYIAELRAQFTEGKFAFLGVARHEINGYNSADYRFGNRDIVLAKAFRRFTNKQFGILPSVGFEFAHIEANSRRETQAALHGSGGNSFQFNPGIQLERNEYVFGCDVAIPLQQKFGDGDALATPRIDISFIRKF